MTIKKFLIRWVLAWGIFFIVVLCCVNFLDSKHYKYLEADEAHRYEILREINETENAYFVLCVLIVGSLGLFTMIDFIALIRNPVKKVVEATKETIEIAELKRKNTKLQEKLKNKELEEKLKKNDCST